MVFCYLYELFWEMHLLFCKCRGWFKNCLLWMFISLCWCKGNSNNTYTDKYIYWVWFWMICISCQIILRSSTSSVCLSSAASISKEHVLIVILTKPPTRVGGLLQKHSSYSFILWKPRCSVLQRTLFHKKKMTCDRLCANA